MSTFDRLQSLSNDRLCDVTAYFSVDEIGEVMSDTIMHYSKYVTNGYRDRDYSHDVMTPERAETNRQFLRDIGVKAVRNVLVAFASFDESSPMVFRGLPMYASKEGRYARSFTGSYHGAIWNDWYKKQMTENDRDMFVPAPSPDELGGYVLVVDGHEKPLAHLYQPFSKMISPRHIDMAQNS